MVARYLGVDFNIHVHFCQTIWESSGWECVVDSSCSRSVDHLKLRRIRHHVKSIAYKKTKRVLTFIKIQVTRAELVLETTQSRGAVAFSASGPSPRLDWTPLLPGVETPPSTSGDHAVISYTHLSGYTQQLNTDKGFTCTSLPAFNPHPFLKIL